MFQIILNGVKVTKSKEKIIQITKTSNKSKSTGKTLGYNFKISTCSYKNECIHQNNCTTSMCFYKEYEVVTYSNREKNINEMIKKQEIFDLFNDESEYFEQKIFNDKDITEEEIEEILKNSKFNKRKIFTSLYQSESNYKNDILPLMEKYYKQLSDDKKTSIRLYKSLLNNRLKSKDKEENKIIYQTKNYIKLENVILKQIVNQIDLESSSEDFIKEKTIVDEIKKTLKAKNKKSMFDITGDKIVLDLEYITLLFKEHQNQNYKFIAEGAAQKTFLPYDFYKHTLDIGIFSKLDFQKKGAKYKILKSMYNTNMCVFIDDYNEMEKFKLSLYKMFEFKNDSFDKDILLDDKCYRNGLCLINSDFVDNFDTNFLSFFKEKELKKDIEHFKKYFEEEIIKIFKIQFDFQKKVDFEKQEFERKIEQEKIAKDLKEEQDKKAKESIKRIQNEMSF